MSRAAPGLGRHDPDRDWERFGRDDPYFGVYVDPRFRRGALDEEALEEFFASGEQHVAAAERVIREALDPGFAPRRALEVGCGVGRLLIPIARRCEQAVGVDVSPSMVAEARRNLRRHGVVNARVLASDETLSGLAGPFDWVHSFIVLQHLPPRRGLALLGRIAGLLAEGGVGVVQLTFADHLGPRARLVAWARRALPLANAAWNRRHGLPADAPWMQMNRYDLNRVLGLLQERGCRRCALRFTDHGGHRGVVLFFQRAPEPGFP